MKTKIYWIAKTAVFIALLVALQGLTASLGNQLITGSLVNLVLIAAVVLGGIGTGLTVAILSPLMAFLLGIGPNQFALIPFIALGNVALVVIWHFICKAKMKNQILNYILATIVGAFVKNGVLYVGIVFIAAPLLLKLPAAGVEKMAVTFGILQSFTALIGGAVACIILPLLVKTIGNMEKRAGLVKTA
ncbi:MAG: hypothetical protein LBM41_03235 [Ruminococcus sp.]|nr:hypothetical protein [Ruminococcus sp.]